MTSVSSSVDTVNAAAATTVTADSRAQPLTIQKRRWGSFWSLYWCFGSVKTSKRISHAALIPEPTLTESAAVLADNSNSPSSVTFPFIAPPSSPTSFLQSDPPTVVHSPGEYQAHIFTIGPYAHENQLVSPPVFSAVTTEPSTAAVTLPPELVQLTTPSSPEVPFAQLLTSSLNHARRNSGGSLKLAFSCYEVHHLIAPGSTNSASGTSSPYPGKRSILEFCMVDASKLFDSKKFSTRNWGSRRGSGSGTPDGTGVASFECWPRENQISEVISLANSETELMIDEARLSFELTHENTTALGKTRSEIAYQDQERTNQERKGNDGMCPEVNSDCKLCSEGAMEMDCIHKRSSISLGSVKEFDFERDSPTSSIVCRE